MCLVAMLVVVGTSCKKTETTQAFVGVLEPMEYEEIDAEGSKMYVVNNGAIFEENDIVMLFNCNSTDYSKSKNAKYYATNIRDDGQTCDFLPYEGNMPTDIEDVFFAYYPGELCYPDLIHQNRAYFELEPTQTYRKMPGLGAVIAENALYAASSSNMASLSSGTFRFSQIGGALGLKLYNKNGGRTVKSITVTDNKFNLSGWVSMKVDKINPTAQGALLNEYDTTNTAMMERLHNYMHGIGYDIIYHGTDYNVHPDAYAPSKSITLDCSKADLADRTFGTSKATGAQFYIGVRPLAFRYGLIIRVDYEEGDYSIVDLRPTPANDRDYRINPNFIKQLNVNLANWPVYPAD